MRTYHHLTMSDRLQIEAWLKSKTSKAEIANLLGVHVSTIYRELERGQYEHLNTDYTTEIRYSPDIAEEKYQENLRAKGAPLKIGNDHEFARYIEKKIAEDKYSPGAVLSEIEHEGRIFETKISKTTLYRYIDIGVFLRVTNKSLPVKRDKTMRKYKKIRPSRAPKGESIEKRPEEINARETFGHWEMDCVEGKKGTKKTLLVLTERKTRGEIIRLMDEKTAASVNATLDEIKKSIGEEQIRRIFQTITVDNGSEFSDYRGIERSSIGEEDRTKIYVCHPYCSYERGSNENQNKLVRRHFPKGFDFSGVTTEEVTRVENWINSYPREMFGGACSAELFSDCIFDLFSA